MKKILFLGLLGGLFMFNACKDKDDDNDTTEPDYHAHIESPTDLSEFHVGDTLHIHVNFEDHNGGTVHHVNVRIYDKISGTDVYNKPDNAHVHGANPYAYEDVFILNVDGEADYVLEAKVWGHDDGVAEVKESVEFHVHD